MATSRNHFASHEGNPERRRNPRVTPTLLTYVSFGGSNGGMVLDVSEEGLALATALAVPDKQLLKIAIPSDQAHQLIEVTGRVVWISESKRRVGLQLVEPSASSQEFLRKWVATVLERTALEAPAVPRFDAAGWNPGAIVDNCAALPLRPAGSEEIAEREFEVVRGLRSQPELTAPELTAVERPQPRGSLVVMGAGHARIAAHIPTTNVLAIPTPAMAIAAPTFETVSPATQSSVIQSSAIQSPEAPISAASIPETTSPAVSSPEVASFAAATPVAQDCELQVSELQVPVEDSEETLLAEVAEAEVDSGEATQLELLIPMDIPVATLPVTMLSAETPPAATVPEEIRSAEILPAAGLPAVIVPTDAVDTECEITTAEPTILAQQSIDSVDANDETKLFAAGAATVPDAERESDNSKVICEEQDSPPALRSVLEDEPHPISAAKPKPIASKQVEKTMPSGRSTMSSPLLFATVAVVAVSFAIGILIGRSVLTQKFNEGTTTVAAAAAPTASSMQRQFQSGAASAPASAPRGVTGPALNVVASNSSIIPSPGSTSTSSPGAQGSRTVFENGVSSGPNGGADQGNSSAAATDSTSGVQMMVTPNEGDAPLRVDLPEEVVAQTATLEIRAQRFLAVPGAGTQRGHKARKERVVIGPLLSRVMPQTPDADFGAASGEQVVSVRATVDGDGHVSYVDPLNGPISLMPAVMSAVREWRFAPSSIHGEPLKTEVDLTLKFRARK
jgi:hypothetical protein